MTTYCSIGDALGLLGIAALYDAPVPPATTPLATQPTLAQGTAMLNGVFAEIDMHLRAQGYVLPIVDTKALAYLKDVAMNGTAARLGKAKWPHAEGPGSDGGATKNVREDYQKQLAFIDNGGLSADVAVTTGAVADGFDHDLTEYDQDGFRVRQSREAPY